MKDQQKTPKAIAFLPWITLDQPLTIGKLRLIPYVNRQSPGNTNHAQQSDIDAVIGAYALRPKVPVTNAVILEWDDWKSGMDPEPFINDLFWARDALAFAALAERPLFKQDFKYCNFHNYDLIVQRYNQASPHVFSFSTRRRDGGCNHFWSSCQFAFHCPKHVSKTPLKIDNNFLAAVLTIPEEDIFMREAVQEFNSANTDSLDVPVHTELVMMKSAFEFLFQIDDKWQSLKQSLEGILQQFSRSSNLEGGSSTPKWQQARPKADKILHAWIQEFCDLRGAAAHGKDRNASRFVWSKEAHLAFTSILFPLMLKAVLEKQNRYRMTDRERNRLSLIEDYILHDPFDFDFDADDQASHPWSEIDLEVLSLELRKRYAT